jgi:hypothetical protein
LWILDSWRDLILYVGTPLLLVPVFALAQARWSPQDIYLFVAAFGAMGHHLPGMIRAYGDRALFERFNGASFLRRCFFSESARPSSGGTLKGSCWSFSSGAFGTDSCKPMGSAAFTTRKRERSMRLLGGSISQCA